MLVAGARAAEARLVAEVEAVLAGRAAAFAAGDFACLGRPLRIVVPSGSLRQHVCAALVRRAGRSLAAVVVQTHRMLAHEVLARAREAAPPGDALVPLLVRRHARGEAALATQLGDLEDGFALVESAVRDFVDAGFDGAPLQLEAIEDALGAAEEAGTQPAIAARARAVARVAARTLASLAERGLGPGSSLLVRAAEILARAGADALPTTALWIHGFADATGLVSDWIEVLVKRLGARVIVAVPRDPADPARSEGAFSDRFRERLAHAAPVETTDAEACAAPEIELVRAPGSAAEVRAAAMRIRALLDAGTRAESIGLVARRLEPYRVALESQLGRLAVPFSVTGAGAGPDAETRRLAALARLLAEAGATPVDSWLDADMGPHARSVDLRVGLHVLGAGRLSDVANLDVDQLLGSDAALVLPVRRGSVEAVDEADAAEPARQRVSRTRSRTLGRVDIERAKARAAALALRLARWPARASFAAQRSALVDLLGTDLGWERDDVALARCFEAIDALAAAAPEDFVLEREEMALLVERALAAAAEPRLGGAGAGVQVLSITQARGRTFDHLFVLGLNRGVFPRVASEDPLVPDDLRRALQPVLPELPVKGRPRDEERHLFAELLSASPRVQLSWQHVSDEGRELARSPLLVRLDLAARGLEALTAPALHELPAAGTPWERAPRPAHEHATLAGLEGPRAALPALRAAALREALAELAPPGAESDPEALARVHLAVLDELDPDLRTPGGRALAARLGPFFGQLGEATVQPASGAGDVGPALFVTRIESVARCPWQAFLRRELRLEPVPDALDALPAPDPQLRGALVHAVLERIVLERLPAAPRKLGELAAQAPVRVPWPDEATLDAWLDEEARELARAEGVRLPGFARALARSVRGCLDAARASDWRDGGPAVLGVEIEGELRVADGAGRARRVGFWADRVDAAGDGGLSLTDYKTGRPIAGPSGGEPAKTDERRRAHLLAAVRSGSALQAPAYWLAARQLDPERPAEGRFLFLRDGIPDAARSLRVDARSEGIESAFGDAVRAVLGALDRGTLFPRLVDARDDEPPACQWCEVAAACLRGESGPRARLRDWSDRAPVGEEPADAALRALLVLGRTSAAPSPGESR